MWYATLSHVLLNRKHGDWDRSRVFRHVLMSIMEHIASTDGSCSTSFSECSDWNPWQLIIIGIYCNSVHPSTVCSPWWIKLLCTATLHMYRGWVVHGSGNIPSMACWTPLRHFGLLILSKKEITFNGSLSGVSVFPLPVCLITTDPLHHILWRNRIFWGFPFQPQLAPMGPHPQVFHWGKLCNTHRHTHKYTWYHILDGTLLKVYSWFLSVSSTSHFSLA